MLTPAGRWFLSGSVIAVALGWVGDTPEAALVGCTGLVLVLLAWLWMVLTPDLLVVRTVEPRRVSVGEPARGVLLVRNLGGRRSPPLVAAERISGATISISLPSLRRGETHEMSYRLPTDHRGVFTVGPFSIGHSDPFRLMQSSTTYASSATITVHPHVHVVSALPTGVNRDLEGPTSASSPRGGIAFHSIRPYEWGDPFRDVHWKKSAQTGQLLVTHKVVPDEPNMMLVLDTKESSYSSEAFEDAVRVAASLCVAAARSGHPLQLRTTGGDVAVAQSGVDASVELLDLLASVKRSADDPGLVALSSMPPGRAACSLGVVTGHPPLEELGMVSRVRHGFLMATVISLGGRSGDRGSDLPGVFSVACPDSAAFAVQWNSSLTH